MNDRSHDDDFDDDLDGFDLYEEDDQGRLSQGLVYVGAGLLTIVGFAAIVWAAYGQGVRDGLKRGPAVIAAPEETYKVRPDDPEGYQVPGRDSEVLARAAGDDQGASETGDEAGYGESEARGLDALIEQETQEEEDAGRDERAPRILGAGDDEAAAESASEDVDAPSEAAASTQREAASPSPTAERGGEPDAGDGSAAATDAADVADPPAEAATDPVEKAAPAVRDPHFVQIASYRSAADADVGWDRFVAANPDLVTSDLRKDVQRADLGERGIYHRLRVGPFEGDAVATRFCEALKAADQSCLVVSG